MPEAQWARLQADLDLGLRRGAWYRVLSVTALEAVLSVHGKPVTVPRPFLQFRATPPRRWSVVLHPRNPSRLPVSLREGYAVCPSCRHRAPLPKRRTPTKRCPQCATVFQVAWDERYLDRG